jgi:hypothetical protein
MYSYQLDMFYMLDDVRRAYEKAGHRASTRLFTYSTAPKTDIGALGTPAQPIPASVRTDHDSIFVWCGLIASIRDNDHDTFTDAELAVFARVTHEGPNYQLTGPNFTQYAHFTGSGQSPHLFGFPYLLGPSSRVTVEWLHVEESFNLATMVLLGAKLFTTPETSDLLQPEHDYALVFPEKLRA